LRSLVKFKILPTLLKTPTFLLSSDFEVKSGCRSGTLVFSFWRELDV
jgi:hypothetical protein